MFWRNEPAGTWITSNTQLCSTLIDDAGRALGSVVLFGSNSYQACDKNGRVIERGLRSETIARGYVMRSLRRR